MTTILTQEGVERYWTEGVLFPLDALSSEEAYRFRAEFEALQAHCGDNQKYIPFPHLFFPWAYELATHPQISGAVAGLLGPDVLIDSTLVLSKYPGDPAFAPWHQDGTYSGWYTTPSTSAWVALSPSHRGNGCMRVVPGSHRDGRLPHAHIPNPDSLFANSPEIQVEVNETDAVDVELDAGQFSLHHSSIVHGSGPHESGDARIGFVIRFITPAFQQRKPSRPVVRVRGAADCGALPLLDKPPSGTTEECFARWMASLPGGLSAPPR